MIFRPGRGVNAPPRAPSNCFGRGAERVIHALRAEPAPPAQGVPPRAGVRPSPAPRVPLRPRVRRLSRSRGVPLRPRVAPAPSPEPECRYAQECGAFPGAGVPLRTRVRRPPEPECRSAQGCGALPGAGVPLRSTAPDQGRGELRAQPATGRWSGIRPQGLGLRARRATDVARRAVPRAPNKRRGAAPHTRTTPGALSPLPAGGPGAGPAGPARQRRGWGRSSPRPPKKQGYGVKPARMRTWPRSSSTRARNRPSGPNTACGPP